VVRDRLFSSATVDLAKCCMRLPNPQPAVEHVPCSSPLPPLATTPTPHLLTHPPLIPITAAGAHMVPTCSGGVKQQLVEFLDRFKGEAAAAGGGSGASAPAAAAGAAADDEQAAVVA